VDDKLAALKTLDLLAHVKRRQLELIARVTDRVELDQGFRLIEQGQVMTHMSIIISGSASVTVDGTEVAVLGPGEVLGELSMIDPAPASASVTMLEPSAVWHMARAGFVPVWEKNRADMSTAMLLAVIARLRETNKLIGS
jgi:CRP-like cAMP-binding protein